MVITNVIKKQQVLILLLISLFTTSVTATSQKLTILTSFSEADVTIYLTEFKKLYPNINVRVVNRKTPAAIDYIQSNPSVHPDIFWATSTDAFEVLKLSGDLQPYFAAQTDQHLMLDGYHVDAQHYYTPFAISGLGLMYNTNYLRKHDLNIPSDWYALKQPQYFRHIGMSAPSRSGTTHVIVETILQWDGWHLGWKNLLEISGNLATVNARSFSVIENVESGLFGLGLVIDFFGYNSRDRNNPVDFSYFSTSPLLAASVAILKESQQPQAAKKFIEFLLSPTGQRTLLDKRINRIPIRSDIDSQKIKKYKRKNFTANKEDTTNGPSFTLDIKRSTARYQLVNALFDEMITFRIDELNKIWRNIHEVEKILTGKQDHIATSLITQARALVTQIPVTEQQSKQASFTQFFQYKRWGRPVSKQQARIEMSWKQQVTLQNIQALELSNKALLHLKGITP